jgi:endonuclease YncB( thermonuclease family)
MARILVALLAALVAALPPAAAQDAPIVGKPEVVTGDTLRFGDRTVRLFAVAAPLPGQLCGVRGTATGSTWRCGQDATFALANAVGNHWITCVPRLPAAETGEIVAVCRAGPKDLARMMVDQGFAVADRRVADDYDADEVTARRAHRGVWQGAFKMPWEWTGEADNR